MQIIKILENIFVLVAIVYLFIDIKIAISLFVISSILHVIPFGPNILSNTIIGYLSIGGFIYLFINWKIGILLFFASFMIVKFRVYAIKISNDYYKNKEIVENDERLY